MPNVWYNNITYIKEGAHMEKRPAWIEKYKRKGTVIQRNGDVYSLYSSKSHREPGKRCPVVERKYIGTVTPDGLVVKTDVNVDNSGIRVYEFGFTYALTKLLPERLGACRMDEDEKLRLFKFLILRNSLEATPAFGPASANGGRRMTPRASPFTSAGSSIWPACRISRAWSG